MSTLRAFLPNSNKVRQVEFHPVQSWVVSATKSDEIIVWDWMSQQILNEFQMGSSDEESILELNLVRSYLRDPNIFPNKSAMHINNVRYSSGSVKDVKFLDLDVVQSEIALRHYLTVGTSSPVPSANHMQILKNSRLLILACESKVLLYDLISKKCSEISKAALDGKSPTNVALLLVGSTGYPGSSPEGVMSSPVLAVGCSDGIVRLIQYNSLRPIARLISSHKTPITSMHVLGAGTSSNGELLIAGYASGGIAAWEPLGRLMTGVEVPARFSISGHDGEVAGIVSLAGVEGAEVCKPLIYTAGRDNRILAWEPATMRQIAKIKIDSKSPITSMTLSTRNWVASGSHSLLLGSEVGLVLAVHPGNGDVRVMSALPNVIFAGQKKPLKIYSVASHPLQPQLLVAGTNSGSALVSFDSMPPLSLAPLPLRHPSAAYTNGGGGVSYVAVMGDSVSCVTATAGPLAVPSAQSSLLDVELSPVIEGPPVVRVVSQLKVASGKPAARASVSVSHDGEYVGVTWAAARQFAIYRLGIAAWEEVATGSGTELAWHFSSPRFAVLDEPVVSGAGAVPRSKVKGKERERDAAMMKAAVEAAEAAAMAGTTVQVRDMRPSGPSTPSSLSLRGEAPIFIYSGPLLGVVYRRPYTTPEGGDLVAGQPAPNVLQFYSWDTLERVAKELPDPLILAWDPSLTFVALVYSADIVIAKVQPAFQVLTTIAISNVTCIEWASRQLFIVTPTHIHLSFISHLNDPTTQAVTPVVYTHTLAAHDYLLAPKTPPNPLSMPGPVYRAPGPLVVLGPRDGYLWLVNALGQPVVVPLNHPALKSRCIAASGDLSTAVSTARALSGRALEDFAAFLAGIDGARGASAALGLAALGPRAELPLRLVTQQWAGALECCRKLLESGRDRATEASNRKGASPPALTDLVDAVSGAMFGTLGGNTGYGGGNGVSSGTVDWLAPLHFSKSNLLGRAQASSISDPEVLDLMLQLSESSLAAGEAETSRSAAQILLRFAYELSPPQISRLACILSDVGLKHEIGRLVNLLVTGADDGQWEGACILAALASGHTSMLQEVLVQEGALALAAVQNTTFRLATTSASVDLWQQQLRGSAGARPGAAAPGPYLKIKGLTPTAWQ